MQQIITLLSQIHESLLFQKRAFNISECSKYTGISESYLYKLTSQNKIPYSKPNGKMIFFDRDLIDEWLLRNPITTQDEAIQKASTTSHLRDSLKIGGKW
ncbi:AlpA family transcriptional regulator [Sediminitomix flava]|uniref:AlpA family transcriptional regulator n=2 Tax=Sediminitomix flava TaxID=379075 RepID=A0A315ZBZ0_SEDFL|nr:AlpA family transcriptional regulator [Sediminitomix flava]